jgi:hypothetical protein
VVGYGYYKSGEDRKAMLQTIRTLQYENTNKDAKGGKDPYKEKAVNNSLTKRTSEIQACYKQFLQANPQKTDGFVEVDWQISPEGKTLKPEVIQTDLESKELGSCITKVLSAIEFPPPPLV